MNFVNILLILPECMERGTCVIMDTTLQHHAPI